MTKVGTRAKKLARRKLFFYPPPNVKKCRKKKRTFFFEFCFTAEFSHFLITHFGGKNIPPPQKNICAQKVTKLCSKKKHKIPPKKKSALFFDIWQGIKKQISVCCKNWWQIVKVLIYLHEVFFDSDVFVGKRHASQKNPSSWDIKCQRGETTMFGFRHYITFN